MAWTTRKNFNYRNTLLHVTDGANTVAVVTETSVIGPAYDTPATVDGDTFDYGYLSGLDVDGARDRDSVDPRTSGIHFKANDGTQIESRYDVSPGTYNIWLAIGDALAAHTGHRVEILDDNTSRLVLTGLSTGEGEFYDAGGNLRANDAAWVANQTSVSVSISSGILKVRLGALTNIGSNTTLAHMGIQKVGTSLSLVAEQGSYVLTGQSIGLLAGGFIAAETGSYTLLGSEALVDVEMNADQGSYALNGQDTNLAGTALLIAETGMYSLIGQATNLLYSVAASIAQPKGQRRMYGFRLNR